MALGWLPTNPAPPARDEQPGRHVFLVAARPRTAPASLDPIATYSLRERAEAWVSIQDPDVQEVLEIHPWRLDEHTDDDYWARAQ